MIPGLLRNWSRTSRTTRPAARATALMARPENRNTTDAPRIKPNSTLGLFTDNEKTKPELCLSFSAPTSVANDPNNAVAASTAVGWADPLGVAIAQAAAGAG